MTNKIVLEERLDSSAAEALLSDINNAQGADLTLDAAGVVVLGGLCLEVLLCAKHVWQTAGQSLSINDASDEFSDHLRRFGLSSQDLTVGEST